MRKLLVLSGLIMLMAATSTAQAQVRQTTTTATHHRYTVPLWFRVDAECIHSYEAPTWRWSPYYHPGYSYWNGYYTGMQFAPSTWDRANQLLNMHTDPATASKLSVMLHAKAIVLHDSHSGNAWREWYPDNVKCRLPYGWGP